MDMRGLKWKVEEIDIFIRNIDSQPLKFEGGGFLLPIPSKLAKKWLSELQKSYEKEIYDWEDPFDQLDELIKSLQKLQKRK